MRKFRTTSWRAFRPDAREARHSGRGTDDTGGTVGACRILGLDPGSRRTGYGILAWADGECVHVAHGCIDVTGLEFAARLRRIYEAVQALIVTHAPDEVAIERVFMSRNADSALKLGQARGAALAAVPAGTATYEYAPREVKRAVVGYGAAEKPQVGHMIAQLLALDARVPVDAADALAVALCHAQSRRVARLARAAGARR
ncbi:MAG: Crossover junction endodeoxyribonuclease RuvC [Steroidobacteraceae bacterium]|nr:Crossover junction endodeoxyribonuclease RuvC [Steroidobacteraceae bacterium]